MTTLTIRKRSRTPETPASQDMSIQRLNLTLSTLSPVQIGTGDDLQPTDYLIDQQKLYRLDAIKMVQMLSPEKRQELIRIAENTGKGQLSKLQRFLYEQREQIKPAAFHIQPVAESVEQYYRSKVGIECKADEKAKLEISQTLKNPFNQTPLIPGSTLKGALRTALLNSLLQGGGIRHINQRGSSQDIEKELLEYRQMNEDPLSGLKVSDCPAAEGCTTQVLFGQQYKKSDPKQLKNKIILETIAPFEIRSFTGQLQLNQHHLQQSKLLAAESLTPEKLLQQLNRFYLPQFIRELERLNDQALAANSYSAEGFNWVHQCLQLLNNIKPAMASGKVALIRLGHFAGAASKSWDDLRSIKISAPGKKPFKFGSDSTTAWLAGYDRKHISQHLPLGWMLIENADAPLPDELLAPFKQAGDDWQQAVARCRKETQEWQAAQAERQRELEQQAAQQAELEAQFEAEKARKEAMSEQDQALERLAEQLANDQRFKIKEPAGELRTLLNTTVALLRESGSAQEKERLKELFTACCNHWETNRKKNAKLKALWQSIDA